MANIVTIFVTLSGLVLLFGAFRYIETALRNASRRDQVGQKKRKNFVPAICYLLGLLSILIGIGFGINSLYFLSHSSLTVAKIVDWETRQISREETSTYCVYQYETETGETFRNRSPSIDPGQAKVGDDLQIRYSVNSPHQSRIDRFSAYWTMPIAMIADGIFIIFVGFILKWRNRRKSS